jgi:hypothetical protein
VGLSLDGDTAEPTEIGSAAEAILRHPSFVSRARHLARNIAEAPGMSAVVRGLEEIAKCSDSDERRLWR